MRLFPLLLILSCFLSCRKDSVQASNSDILMGHLWFPYQVHIETVDSNSVTIIDSAGGIQTQSKVDSSDTTYFASQCQQQSSYNFGQDGILIISNSCNATQPISESWTITQTNVLTFFPPDYSLYGPIPYGTGGTGPVTHIDNSQFTFNNQRLTEYDFGTSSGPDSSKINTTHKILRNVFATFKSK